MTFHISPRRRLQSARRRAASAERRRRMRRSKGVSGSKGHFLFFTREKCACVCVYSLHKSDDCFSFLSCCELQISSFWSTKYKTHVSLSFFLSFDDPSVLKKLLLFLALVLLLFLLPRQIERILRPLVLGTLFRASSFRSQGGRNTERKRCVPHS